MGWNFKKRIKLNDFISLNVGKKGVSTSFKFGPITINPKKGTTTIRTPIKGLSYTKRKKKG